jgi:hypothetical protein
VGFKVDGRRGCRCGTSIGRIVSDPSGVGTLPAPRLDSALVHQPVNLCGKIRFLFYML